MADRSQQTEKASPQRLKKAREKGQFPAAKELVSAVQFVVFVALLGAWLAGWLKQLRITASVLMERAFHADLSMNSLVDMAWWIYARNLSPLAIFGLVLLAVTFAVQLAVTGFGVSFAKLAPDFSRLNPIEKLSGLPRQNIPALLQALFMLPLFAWAVWWIAKQNRDLAFTLPLGGLASGLAASGHAVSQLLWRASALFVFFGLINFVRQRRQYANDMKMSKQEVKEEARDSEGNPQMKQRIRRLQRDMRRKNMMNEVATATAVVVNPTHYAVAIKYSIDSMAAPSVVAKGKNYLALRIRQRAIENQVPIIENPPLAQALYKSVDVGQEIPAHLYRAVAEILAYIFKLMNGRMPG